MVVRWESLESRYSKGVEERERAGIDLREFLYFFPVFVFEFDGFDSLSVRGKECNRIARGAVTGDYI